MIAFEIALLIFFAVVIIAGLVTLARPMTEAFSERLKFKYRDMGSQSEKLLKDRVNSLEGEVLSVKQQVTSLQETVEFLSKELEGKQVSGATIKTPGQKEPTD